MSGGEETNVPRMMRPGPWRRPARTILGGPSRMETNSGLSTGCSCLAERGRVDEKGLRGARMGDWRAAVRAHSGPLAAN